MTNLILTHLCNQKCSFCFTDFISCRTSQQLVDLASFKKMLNLLRISNFPQIRLLGGEPTLHPQFPQILEIASKEEKPIVIFSNGIMTDQALQSIKSIGTADLIVLLNINVYFMNLSIPSFTNQIRNVLIQLGEKCQLGYTIQNAEIPFSSMQNLIKEFNLSKSIRFGLAQPTGRNNQFLSPRHYPFIGKKMIDAMENTQDNYTTFELDCGFVRCMFPDHPAQLFPPNGDFFTSHCSPIIDMDIDGSAVPCFPLSEEVRMTNAISQNRSEITQFFQDKLAKVQGIGIYPECGQCAYLKNQECNGGCLAAVLKRFHSVVK
jgi:MoaA/NifB/PqqE/SkfB family radical SAM enzyme